MGARSAYDRKRRARIALIVAAIALIAASAALLRRDDRIEALATRAGSTRGWHTRHASPVYWWLDNGDVLFLAIGGTASTTAFQQRISASGPWDTPVELTRFPSRPWDPVRPSPDGKWLLFWGVVGQSGAYSVAPLAGPHKQSTPRLTGSLAPQWTPDSSATVGITPIRDGIGTHAEVYHVDSRRTDSAPLPDPVNGPAWALGLLNVSPTGHLLVQRDRIAFFGRRDAPGVTSLTFADVDLRHPRLAPRIWSVPIPKGTDAGEIRVSPQGDRILWMLATAHRPPFEVWLRRAAPWLRRPTERVIWRVSRLDGSAMHDVGHYDSFDPGLYELNPILPKWTADGKHVSFIENDNLYLLPVP